MATLTRASTQWANRPDDERFLSLDDLGMMVRSRRDRAVEPVMAMSSLAVQYDDSDRLFLVGASGERAEFSHAAFGQVSRQVGAPAEYLRRLPTAVAALNLTYGLRTQDGRSKLLIVPDADPGIASSEVRAVTSATYGRIWDAEVLDEVERINSDGRWVVPSASYQARDPLRATTLYASDHDIFIFLVDPEHEIEINGTVLHRGFMAWNSETGARTFGLTTFLYEYVCDNRMIWGATEVNELIIRHTKGGPDRFAALAAPALAQYAESGTGELVKSITAAQSTRLGDSVAEVEAWMLNQGFSPNVARESLALVEHGEAGPGDPTTVWGVAQGVTAYARTIARADDRFDLERRVLDLAALVS